VITKGREGFLEEEATAAEQGDSSWTDQVVFKLRAFASRDVLLYRFLHFYIQQCQNLNLSDEERIPYAQDAWIKVSITPSYGISMWSANASAGHLEFACPLASTKPSM
jgi:hypothetical protein